MVSLAEAAAAAGYAPSINDTQPWRWRIGTDTMDLYLQRARVLAVMDPDARLATLSCGAALHHARIALAAEGWHVTIARMPDAADQEHLANIRVYAPAAASPEAERQMQTIPVRRTDRRPAVGPPVGAEDLRTIGAAVQAEGAWLHLLHPDQVIELAAAANDAVRAEAGDPHWRADLAYWTGERRPAEHGPLDAATPHDSPPMTVPARDFRPPTDRPISLELDKAARFAIVHGRSDESRDWLRAGEALSAGWLTATERGVSVLPISAPVEVPATRDAMRRMLSYLSHPFLVVRLSKTHPVDAPGGTPRPAAAQIIERP
jgi:nitroreductase